MGSLLLVRHAQASFFEADYDLLSPVGEEQAQRLGEYWAKLGWNFDEVYTGPRVRHRHTAEIVGKPMKHAGLAWPQAEIEQTLDEHAVDRLVREAGSALAHEHPHLGPLAQAYAQAQTRIDKQKAFQKLFEALVKLWSEGACTIPEADTWPEFRDRVRAFLSEITGIDKPGRRVAAFTSVGPISAALGWVLSCPDSVAFETGWRLRNASITEIVFTRGRVTLDTFNALPHLRSPKLWTFR